MSATKNFSESRTKSFTTVLSHLNRGYWGNVWNRSRSDPNCPLFDEGAFRRKTWLSRVWASVGAGAHPPPGGAPVGEGLPREEPQILGKPDARSEAWGLALGGFDKVPDFGRGRHPRGFVVEDGLRSSGRGYRAGNLSGRTRRRRNQGPTGRSSGWPGGNRSSRGIPPLHRFQMRQREGPADSAGKGAWCASALPGTAGDTPSRPSPA